MLVKWVHFVTFILHTTANTSSMTHELQQSSIIGYRVCMIMLAKFVFTTKNMNRFCLFNGLCLTPLRLWIMLVNDNESPLPYIARNIQITWKHYHSCCIHNQSAECSMQSTVRYSFTSDIHIHIPETVHPILIDLCKEDVTPLLTHWSNVFFCTKYIDQ